MKYFVLILSLLTVSSPAFSAESLQLLRIKSIKQYQKQLGKIQIRVVSVLPCGVDYLGLVKLQVAPFTLSNPTFEVRSIGSDTGTKCMAAESQVIDSFEVDAIAGQYAFLKVQP